MVCPTCHHANPPDSVRCTKCSTPFPLEDQLTLEGQSDHWSAPAAGAGAHGSGDLKPGTLLGERYEIVRMVGQGGMGAVYEAHDREVDRRVALKVIRGDLAAHREILNRFKQELILARQITHRNVIRIFDVGQADGVKFITMEYIDGEDLHTLLRREKKLGPDGAAGIMVQVCRALEAAHGEGVVHRDLKPQNIMIDKNGRAYVMDFGIARSEMTAGMTETGAVIGTPDYMSPEQAKGLQVDARSDLFSFGIIFHELLSGRNPFEADTAMGKLWKRTSGPARPLSDFDKSIPQPLSEIVRKCLEIEPQKRFANATEVLRGIEDWQTSGKGRRDSRRTAYAKWIAAGAAVVALAILLRGTRQKLPATPAVARPPVTMLIADFDNKTGEGIFNGTLESVLGIALEGASFISSYDRGKAKEEAQRLQPSAALMDKSLAQLVAQREGINLIVAGSIAADGKGYKVYVTTLDAATGRSIVQEQQAHASSKQDVLSATGKLAEKIRKGLGDTVPESAQQSAAETYTAASLEAAHAYAQGQDLLLAAKFTEAIKAYRKAIELDPAMGRAYAGIASAEQNLGRQTEAEANYKLALSHIDRMTDREKYRTRGAYYLLIRDITGAIQEQTRLVKEYPADTSGHANLALAYFYARDLDKAIEEQKRAVAITPHSVLEHSNLSQYALYSGDFDTAIAESQQLLKNNPNFETGARTLAVAKLATGHIEDARQEYARLEAMSPRGASMALTGFADLALFEGRPSEAEKLLEKAVAADAESKNADAAANAEATLAMTQATLNKAAQARAMALKAVAASQDPGILYRAAQVFLAIGDLAQAQQQVAPLARRLESEPQVYVKLIAGEAQLKRGRPREALASFQEAQKLLDTWLGRLDLGRAYLDLGAFTQASSEFDACLRRRGEATSVFFDDIPSYHWFPDVLYYQGRAREGLNSPGAAESYQAFLTIKAKGEGDPLVADARKRLGHAAN